MPPDFLEDPSAPAIRGQTGDFAERLPGSWADLWVPVQWLAERRLRLRRDSSALSFGGGCVAVKPKLLASFAI